MMEKIKIFGERNTSTNALKALIETNSKSRVVPSVAREIDPSVGDRLKLAKRLRAPGFVHERILDDVFRKVGPLHPWKHVATDFDDVEAFDGCHVVFCIRHPASWVLGLYKHPYHIHGKTADSLHDFLNTRWKTVRREGLGRSATGATALYNRKMAAFLKLHKLFRAAGVSFSVVRHEDFAVNQAQVFSDLKPCLHHPARDFSPLERSTKAGAKDRTYYQDYYGNQKWWHEITPEVKNRIDHEMDWSLVRDFGYSPSD